MTKYISQHPLVMLVPVSYQRDRYDTFYYDPRFHDLDELLDGHQFDSKTVEELTELVTDGTHVTPTYVDEGVLFLSSGNIKERGIVWGTPKFISRREHESLSNCQPFPKDVLVAKSGTVGIACVFPDDGPECSAYESVAIVRPKQDELDSSFLSVFLNSDLALKQIQRSQKGIAIKHLHLTDLREIRVPYLDTDKQREIVRRYRQVERLRGKFEDEATTLEQEIENTFNTLHEAYCRSLGLESFPVPWHDRLYLLSRENSGDRLDVLGSNPQFNKQCETAGVFVPLADVCEVDGSNSQISVGDQRYLSIENLPGYCWGEITPESVNVTESVGRKRFEKGDIAWAHLKPSIVQGKCFIVREQSWGSHHFLRLQTSSLTEAQRVVVWAYLKLAPIRRHLANQCTGKSESQKDVSADQLALLPFPRFEIDDYDNVYRAIMQTISRTDAKREEAVSRRRFGDALLAKAKANIFALLDDDVFDEILRKADDDRDGLTKNGAA